MIKPWEVISSELLGSFRIFNLRENRARSPRTGQVHGFYVLESADWVNVIPLTSDNRLVMVRQYRHGSKEITLEIPGGLVDPNDTPREAAVRELMEETGYGVREIIPLGKLRPHPALFDNHCYTFLATGVYPAGNTCLDEAEDIETVLVPLNDVPVLIEQGEIVHSLVLTALYLLMVRCPDLCAQKDSR